MIRSFHIKSCNVVDRKSDASCPVVSFSSTSLFFRPSCVGEESLTEIVVSSTKIVARNKLYMYNVYIYISGKSFI